MNHSGDRPTHSPPPVPSWLRERDLPHPENTRRPRPDVRLGQIAALAAEYQAQDGIAVGFRPARLSIPPVTEQNEFPNRPSRLVTFLLTASGVSGAAAVALWIVLGF